MVKSCTVTLGEEINKPFVDGPAGLPPSMTIGPPPPRLTPSMVAPALFTDSRFMALGCISVAPFMLNCTVVSVEPTLSRQSSAQANEPLTLALELLITVTMVPFGHCAIACMPEMNRLITRGILVSLFIGYSVGCLFED